MKLKHSKIRMRTSSSNSHRNNDESNVHLTEMDIEIEDGDHEDVIKKLGYKNASYWQMVS